MLLHQQFKHTKENVRIHKTKINISVFMWIKLSKIQIVHDPIQHSHLRKYINAKMNKWHEHIL